MRMMLGNYCLADLMDNIMPDRDAIYARAFDDREHRRIAASLESAKKWLLVKLPESCRASVTWEGEL